MSLHAHAGKHADPRAAQSEAVEAVASGPAPAVGAVSGLL